MLSVKGGSGLSDQESRTAGACNTCRSTIFACGDTRKEFVFLLIEQVTKRGQTSKLIIIAVAQ